MAQTDLFKRYLDAGVAYTQMTQAKAEEIVRDLVRAGEVQAEDTRKWVEELLERSRQNTEDLMALVRSEVQSQVAKLGLVPKSEVQALRRELADLKAKQPATKKAAPPAKKAPVKKASAKKATTARKAGPAKKTAPNATKQS